jgi:type II secretory ATPase GspE/PulE/Tfp pilus assembly ATPase PilB-like protein
MGYKGRTCISETMIINEQLRDLISQRAPFQKIKEVARETAQMQTLYESAIKKVESGVTSLEEALSVTLGAD